MSARGIQPIVSEYNLLWEALKYYQGRLERLSSMSTEEDEQLRYDEKLQDIAGILESVRIAARNGYQLELK